MNESNKICPISQKICDPDSCAWGAEGKLKYPCFVKTHLESIGKNQERMNTTLDEMNKMLKYIEGETSSIETNTDYNSNIVERLDNIIKILKNNN